MNRFIGFLVLVILLIGLTPKVSASGEEEGDFDAISHTADGNYLDFSPLAKIELPRILLVRDANGSLGLDFYGSTHSLFESGKYNASWEEKHEEEKVTKVASSEMELEELMHSHQHVYAKIVPKSGEIVLDLSITRHLVYLLFASLLVCIIFITLANRYKKGIGRETAPKGIFHNLFESFVVFIRDDIARPNLGDKANKYLPYLLSVFFIILFCNLFGMIPWGGTATANITVTATLAIFTFILTQLAGTKDYWLHVFWPPGIPLWMKPILIPIEILGLFTKPFALAVRLYANMTAGHLVILNFIGLIFLFRNVFHSDAAAYGISIVSVGMALFINCIELLVAFIQAYVFTMLSALFIGMAAEEHHHEEHAHEVH